MKASASDRLHALVAKRIRRLAKVRDLAAECLGMVEPNVTHVRRKDVAEYVAFRLGIEVSNDVYAAVKTAVRSLGWTPVKTNNRSLFKRGQR